MKLLYALLVSVGFALSQPKIVVEKPWVREVPPVSTMSAAFMVIKNIGDEEDVLVSAQSPIAGVTEIHTTIMENGMMKMRMLKEVKIPAGGSVVFKPMGKHIMLIDLKEHPKGGEKVKLILIFKKSGKLEIEVPVRGMGHHMMNH